MAVNWVRRAAEAMERKGTKGAFTKQARARGMTPMEFARKVKANPSAYDTTTVRRAMFALNANSRRRRR
jgi:hypothetical protein